MTEYVPMKAVLVHAPFSDPRWIFERKLDGIRCGAIRHGGSVRLLSRSGEVMTPTYPELVEALENAGPDVIADGEIVAFERGMTSFARLQKRMHIRDPELARRSRIAAYYYLFDLLELEAGTCVPARCWSASASCAARRGSAGASATHRTGWGTVWPPTVTPARTAGRG